MADGPVAGPPGRSIVEPACVAGDCRAPRPSVTRGTSRRRGSGRGEKFSVRPFRPAPGEAILHVHDVVRRDRAPCLFGFPFSARGWSCTS